MHKTKADTTKVIRNFIGGDFREPSTGEYLLVEEPARGRPFAQVASSGAEDVAAAVEAASTAASTWSRTAVHERVMWLRRLAGAVRERLEDFAIAESRDTGKPLSTARTVDIPRSIANFEFFADAITQFHGDSFLTDLAHPPGTNSPQALNWTWRKPLGAVACVSPWNLPLYLLSWKIAPALAAGNTVVAKPSEVTPLTAHMLAETWQNIDGPSGVLNLVHGLGHRVGPHLVTHPKIKAISFTGSTATGATIAGLAAPLFKKVSLEMGGKNPTLVFADSDLEAAVNGCLRAAFSNQGQICLCGSRIFVEQKIYDRFRDRLIEKIQELRQGDPLDPTTEQGALVSLTHLEKVKSAVAEARQAGGRILTGGETPSLPGELASGYFYPPTLIDGLAASCRTNQEEIFGPVATLIPFEEEAQVIDWANDTRYGLAASLWTMDIDRALRIAQRLEAGLVWINSWMVRDLRTPFGGVKDSGVGREGGWAALEFFTEVQNVTIPFGQKTEAKAR